MMNKLYISFFVYSWYTASINDVVAERVLDVYEGEHVSCPGQPDANLPLIADMIVTISPSGVLAKKPKHVAKIYRI